MADDPKKDRDVMRVQDLAAQIKVHFSDFVLVVRTRDGMAWKHSDPTYGVGAATRYLKIVEDLSRMDYEEQREEHEGGEE